MSYRSKPVFSSAARLAALARFVSENSTPSEPTTPVPSALPGGRTHSQSYSSGNAITERNQYNNQSYQTVNPKFYNNARTLSNPVPRNDLTRRDDSGFDDTESISSLSNIPPAPTGPIFSVISAGFKSGNFSEFKFGQKTFVPRQSSRRGMSLLCLTPDHTAFHAWNFDFYPNITRNATNRNFINILLALPGNIYFGLAVKDDAHKNLFEATKNFLSRVVGLKTIYRMEYRDSWCAVIYKKSPQTFEVLQESHNPTGPAYVNVHIPARGPPIRSESEPVQPAVVSPSIRSPHTPAVNTYGMGDDVPHLDPDVEHSEPNTPRQEPVRAETKRFMPNVHQANIRPQMRRNFPNLGDNSGVSNARISPSVNIPVHNPALSQREPDIDNYGSTNDIPHLPSSIERSVTPSHSESGDVDTVDETPSPARNLPRLPRPRVSQVAPEPIEPKEARETKVPTTRIVNAPVIPDKRIPDSKLKEEIHSVSQIVKEQQSSLREVRKEIERMKVHIKEQLAIVKKILTAVTHK